MRVAVVGTGYVGLVTGAGLAETGAEVLCADIDAAKVEALNNGILPIFEPGLDPIVKNNVEAGRLRFTNDVAAAIAQSEFVFTAVGTPSRSDGAADLRAVDQVAETVAKHAQRETVLVLKSTVPVGTNARVKRITKDAPQKIHVVSNPEFLKEGDAVSDFFKPDRIVVGCDAQDEFARKRVERLYHPVSLSGNRIVWMNPESAELTKYVANTMLAMRISFMNEIALLCEQVGADIHAVRKGVGSDSRIGSKFLHAGPGYGGSCFPKDVTALVQTAHDHGMELELASATDRINNRQKGIALRKLRKYLSADLRGKRVAVWGLAFKPRTDDVRQAPSLTLIENLLAERAEVRAHDPQASETVRKHFGDELTLSDDAYSAAEGADALVLLTEWRQYQNPDFARLKSLMRNPLVLDCRNIWTGYNLKKQGFTYEGIGILTQDD